MGTFSCWRIAAVIVGVCVGVLLAFCGDACEFWKLVSVGVGIGLIMALAEGFEEKHKHVTKA